MAGYILILAVIILGGAIATVGDRIGTRVGKARLSLFNLRPRNTAILVTILTGSIISASTLGVLLATSKELRDGVLRIESIQQQRKQAEAELNEALQQKQEIQQALESANTELEQARTRLGAVNRTLASALARQQKTQKQLNYLQDRYLTAQKELRQFSEQGKVLRGEIQRLDAAAQQLQREQSRLIAQRNQVAERLQAAETEKDVLETAVSQARGRLNQVESQKQTLEAAIAQSQRRLREAEEQQAKLAAAVTQAQNQQVKLQNEITSLETSRKRLQENVDTLLLGLRQGNVTIRAGQVLASGLIQGVNNRSAALQAFEALLREARKTAIVLTNPQKLTPTDQVVHLLNADVERTIQRLQDGQPYFVRILAAGNYLEGETVVLVVPQLAPNQVVFSGGEQVATVTLNPAKMSDDQILNRLERLFSISNQRAIQAGVLPDPVTGAVGSFRQIDLIKFVLQLKEYDGDVDVMAVVPNPIYTSGPLKLELIALQNQRVIFKSS
uniref:DUF3084 domain-containing protein n=1 Tax=Cyanothece sp. (strain PCC 7425 / ATCC 29141) TaxID=395961 RepID=B8HK30_CYAP4